ncbi:MAG: polysaccharide deacetylase family protein [Methylobacter sp.]|nr:polysaccharide deacetylase family protein [Methylobacter sp.]
MPEKTVILTFDDGYADNYEGAFLPLLDSNMKATWFITTGCIGKNADWMGPPSPQTQMLTAEQLVIMAKAGMEMGSHTCSHPDLTMLSSSQQLDEMTQSKQILESIIAGKIASFAYPYGRYNENSIATVKEAGYESACTTCPGWFRNEESPFLVRRITIFANDTVHTLARKLVFADNNVSWKKMASYYYLRINDKLIKAR